METEEQWLPTDTIGIPGYFISQSGLCKNKAGIILKKDYNVKGYIRYQLYFDGKHRKQLAHRLVAKLYKLNPLNKPEVNHLDEDIHNNWDWNLEWATKSENSLHSRNRRKEELAKDCPF